MASPSEGMTLEQFRLQYNFTPRAGEEELSFDLTLYIMPAIIVVGLVGNFISLFTILNSRLRKVTANQYLIVMTSSDTLMLMGVALITFKVDYFSFESCLVIEYVMMSASYVSAWTTAALTVERYLALVFPLLNVRLATKSRVKMLMAAVPIPFLLQLCQFVFIVPGGTEEGERACKLKDEDYQFFVELADTIMCYGLPCLVVVVLNVLIALKMKSNNKTFSGESRAIRRGDVIRESRRSGGPAITGNLAILWVVPLMFVVLNTPYYIFKMVHISPSVSEGPPEEPSAIYKSIGNMVSYIYYLNFALDVIFYAFSSANFRRSVVQCWKKLFDSRRRPEKNRSEISKHQPLVMESGLVDSGTGSTAMSSMRLNERPSNGGKGLVPSATETSSFLMADDNALDDSAA